MPSSVANRDGEKARTLSVSFAFPRPHRTRRTDAGAGEETRDKLFPLEILPEADSTQVEKGLKPPPLSLHALAAAAPERTRKVRSVRGVGGDFCPNFHGRRHGRHPLRLRKEELDSESNYEEARDTGGSKELWVRHQINF